MAEANPFASLRDDEDFGWPGCLGAARLPCLPGTFNGEGAEVGGLGFDQFVFDDGIDPAAAGAFMQLRAEVGEGFGGARGDDLDFAAVVVADAAVETEFGGLAVDEPAEAYALNPATNKEMDYHTQRVSQNATGRAKSAVFTKVETQN